MFYTNFRSLSELFDSYRYKIRDIDWGLYLPVIYPYCNLALIKGENPAHFPVRKHRLLK